MSWFEQNILRKTLNQAAQAGQLVYLFLDEVQNLSEWAPQLKHLVDTSDVRVLVTGSSALRIEQGRDSLAGRITTLEMGTLFLRESMALRREGELRALLPPNGLAPLRERAFWEELRAFGVQNAALRERAFAAFSERGAYPIAHARPRRRLGGVSRSIERDGHSPRHHPRLAARTQRRQTRSATLGSALSPRLPIRRSDA